MSTSIYAGAAAPAALTMTITPGTSGVDLSTISAASLQVTGPRGLKQTWTATRSNQSPTTLTLTHVFDSAGKETEIPGDYRITAYLFLPGGRRRGVPATLTVLA